METPTETQKKPRVVWKNESITKTFLEACIREAAANGRQGSSLRAQSWEKVIKTLKETHNFVVDQKQAKNRYDYTRYKYQDCCRLKNKTGNLYDAAYINTRGFLTPFRNTRYWLADFNSRRASTRQEKFNHAHARLRNVIKRAYGVLKSRFPILKQMAPYPFSVQRDIVVACFAVHNFIRMEKIDDTLFAEYDDATSSDEEEEGNRIENQLNREQHYRQQWGAEGVQYMNNLRDQIANQLD